MFLLIAHVVVVSACLARILLRPHRDPTSRLAWMVVVLAVPFAGALAYLLLGETNIGTKRVSRLKKVFDDLPRPEDASGWDAIENQPALPELVAPLFNVAGSINGYQATGGNRARLMKDSDATIDEMVADVDAATDHVHLMFYIWLTDNNGTKMIEALKRAAARGVTCRAMVDDLGSRDLVHSQQWKDMAAAGVRTASALKIGNPLVRMFDGRVDLRDHRKILVIDNRVTYCGSQNCADPAFLPKKKFAPWVDAVMRFEGPVVRQNQHLFASDWMANCDEDISDVLLQPMPAAQAGFTAQAVGTGPTVRNSAMPEMFETLMYAARRELFITTPYYVPNGSMQAALCAAANRGVDTSIIFPARNDDFAVGATSKSYYLDLLTAGVKIYEYQKGILHTKSLTLDGDITLIGSANMDRRSFDLNYENNILLHDPALTADMRARQQEYLAECTAVSLQEVQAWPWTKRLWNNALAIVGPVL
ncbi:cardiolipin synthase [Falsiphaeobacter marinintestinus]|uniref:cardiolipin synthase n=1 Tax=Falsiphaeobacter marinintestinus TaxID=1492905 RepID=UPI0011B5BA27|nr:cardiolipin synthase [Phaeobacter marinintestinus]